MSIKASLSTKLKGPPAPTGDPFDLSAQTPHASQAQGSGITTRPKLPVILTATGAVTPGAAGPKEASSANPKAPAFQKPEALQFLALLGKDPRTTYFRTIRPGSGANRSRRGADLLGFDAAALEADSNTGEAIYVVIGRATGASGKNKAGKPTGAVIDDDIADCPALFVEWDDRPKDEQLTAWQGLGLPEPTAMIDSGGKSVHNYWRLAEPITPAQWREATARLIAHCGSDRSCSNPSRVMRLPGFRYWDKQTGKPTGTRAELLHTSTNRCTLAEMLACLPDPQQQQEPTPAPQAVPPRPQASSRYGARPLEQAREALACIPPILPKNGKREEFRAIAWGLLKAVREAGESDAMALALLEEHSPLVGDAGEYLQTEPHTINAGTFWHHARAHGWTDRAQSRASGAPLAADRPGDAEEHPAPTKQQKARQPNKPKKIGHTKAMRCFDRCVEIQAKQQRNTLTRRARLLKAAADLGIGKYLNRQEISQRILEVKAQQQGQQFEALTAADRLAMMIPEVRYLIENLIPADDATIIGGRPKVGKTRFAVAVAASVLTGREILGFKPTETAPVVLVTDDQADGDSGQMLKSLRIWDHPNLIWSRHFRLTETDLDKLLEAVKANPGALVILDSLRSISRALQYGENDPEIGAILYDLKAAVIEAGGSLLIIHHCNKADGLVGTEALSGHNAIPGAVNTVVTIHYCPDPTGKSLKAIEQRRIVVEGRSVKPADLVMAPTPGTGGFHQISTFEAWQASAKDAEDQQKQDARATPRQKQVLEALENGEGWMTRKEVCEALDVPWEGRGRNPEAMGIDKVLRSLAAGPYVTSERAGTAATYRHVSHETQISMETIETTSDSKGSGIVRQEGDNRRQWRQPVTARDLASESTESPGDGELSPVSPKNETPVPDRLSPLSPLSPPLEQGGEGRINPARITIGATVSKWSKAERRHIPGWLVLGIEGDEATVQRASGGGRLTVPLSDLRMER